ncbi:hypothetical protein FPV67DRAFT_1455890 [Lyophyllum atratum]|nr:hypothetical protein FPV67DRAFT_1455890 [Lyophyllum atratum]
MTPQTEIRNTCRVVVFEPDRIDYGNPAIIAAVLAKLKKYMAYNGFKDYFNGKPLQAHVQALRKAIGVDASTMKSQFKKLISLGILGNENSGPRSLTENLRDGMQKFMGLANVPDVKHAMHFLLMRAFARKNKVLLVGGDGAESEPAEGSEPLSSDSDSQDNTCTPGKRKRRTGGATKGKDFASKLTRFFERKYKAWGDNISTGSWAVYIDAAIAAEEKKHPDDKMPLIPRCTPSAPPASPAMPSMTMPTTMLNINNLSHSLQSAEQAQQAGGIPYGAATSYYKPGPTRAIAYGRAGSVAGHDLEGHSGVDTDADYIYQGYTREGQTSSWWA